MAGVGFELKKLFKDNNGYLDTFKAYSVSAIVTEGPVLLCVFMLLILQYIILKTGGSFVQRENFLILVTYTMIFSMIIANVFALVMSRYISDCIYSQEYSKIFSSYLGVSCILIVLGTLFSSLLVLNIGLPVGLSLVFIAQFCMVIITWIQITYLNCIKHYVQIVFGFFIAFVLATMCGFLLNYLIVDKVFASLLSWAIGYFGLFMALNYSIIKYYTYDKTKIFDFIRSFDDYLIISGSGLFLTLGIYGHNFVMWFSEYHTLVYSKLRFCMMYDVPAFFASFTIIPMLVIFTVMIEVNFHEKFKKYFTIIRNHGRLEDMTNAKAAMKRVLTSDLAYMCEVQLFVAILSSTIIGNYLSTIGLDANMLGIYRILCFGYCFYGITRCGIVLLFYFNDLIGAFLISALFAILSVSLTIVSTFYGLDYYGIGFLLAAIITTFIVVARIYYYLNRIEYYVICAQPIFFRVKAGVFTQLANLVGGSHEEK